MQPLRQHWLVCMRQRYAIQSSTWLLREADHPSGSGGGPDCKSTAPSSVASQILPRKHLFTAPRGPIPQQKTASPILPRNSTIQQSAQDVYPATQESSMNSSETEIAQCKLVLAGSKRPYSGVSQDLGVDRESDLKRQRQQAPPRNAPTGSRNMSSNTLPRERLSSQPKQSLRIEQQQLRYSLPPDLMDFTYEHHLPMNAPLGPCRDQTLEKVAIQKLDELTKLLNRKTSASNQSHSDTERMETPDFRDTTGRRTSRQYPQMAEPDLQHQILSMQRGNNQEL